MENKFEFWNNLHTNEGLDLVWITDFAWSNFKNKEINQFRDQVKSTYHDEDDHYIQYYLNNELIFWSKLTGYTFDIEGNKLDIEYN